MATHSSPVPRVGSSRVELGCTSQELYTCIQGHIETIQTLFKYYLYRNDGIEFDIDRFHIVSFGI